MPELSKWRAISVIIKPIFKMMKKLFFVLPIASVMLVSCGESTANDALDGALTESGDIDAAVVSFADGGATDGEQYFSGVLAEVVEVDVKLREVKELDEMDATEEEIKITVNESLQLVTNGRMAIMKRRGLR